MNYQILTPQAYVDLLVKMISQFEGQEPKARDTSDGEITIGYGYTFGRNDNVSLWQGAGISLSAADLQTLQKIDAATTKADKNSIALTKFTRPITKDEAIALLRETFPKYEGPANTLNMPPSLGLR